MSRSGPREKSGTSWTTWSSLTRLHMTSCIRRSPATNLLHHLLSLSVSRSEAPWHVLLSLNWNRKVSYCCNAWNGDWMFDYIKDVRYKMFTFYLRAWSKPRKEHSKSESEGRALWGTKTITLMSIQGRGSLGERGDIVSAIGFHTYVKNYISDYTGKGLRGSLALQRTLEIWNDRFKSLWTFNKSSCLLNNDRLRCPWWKIHWNHLNILYSFQDKSLQSCTIS